jgi:hypothetical protein
MALQDLLGPDLQNLFKFFGWLNSLSIKQIKGGLFDALLEIKSIKQKKKTWPFCVHEQKNPKNYFPEFISLSTHLEY